MDFLYQQFIANKQKAIVGFIVGFLSTYLAQHGLTLEMTLGGIVENILYGILGYIGVYVKRNQG